MAIRRLRGDRLGPEPFREPQVVLDAYKGTGSIMGAARALTAAGVPTARGGPWAPTTVRQILERHWPGLVPKLHRKGAKPQPPFMFAGLLECHCGRILTGHRYQNGSNMTYTTYRCFTGRNAQEHGLQSSRVSTPIRFAMTRMHPPANQSTSFIRPSRRSGELELLDQHERVYEVGTIDWSAGARDLNEMLRGILKVVRMGPDQRPQEAPWWFPEWRRD